MPSGIGGFHHTWLDIYVRHPLEHAAQIKKILEKL